MVLLATVVMLALRKPAVCSINYNGVGHAVVVCDIDEGKESNSRTPSAVCPGGRPRSSNEFSRTKRSWCLKTIRLSKSMSDQPKRRFQFHLSTAVAMIVAIGWLMWALQCFCKYQQNIPLANQLEAVNVSAVIALMILSPLIVMGLLVSMWDWTEPSNPR